ncbi:MAG TPA: hypothetical protein IAA18_10545 [Candidatus Pseudomonas excrementavium]|uniref:hypothetical protein n=1 Tax=Halopseudomonas bauzanensis TaxID=653930 RepID=UPI001C3ABEB3|nr:hypothetical protein [Halopseudomonas bauzanensis]HIZ51505.1 hypothetical protein [Candidatus Pseudomonas excrementavium]
MGQKHRFLISYILDNQPMNIEVECTGEHMTPEQARAHIEARHENSSSDQITDIRISPILHPDSEPGHNYQP